MLQQACSAWYIIQKSNCAAMDSSFTVQMTLSTSVPSSLLLFTIVFGGGQGWCHHQYDMPGGLSLILYMYQHMHTCTYAEYAAHLILHYMGKSGLQNKTTCAREIPLSHLQCRNGIQGHLVTQCMLECTHTPSPDMMFITSTD